MSAIKIEEIYEKYIKSLSDSERLKLVEMIAHDLAVTTAPDAPRKRSLLELEGLGKEIWESIDAQEYVNELRKEWDHRP